jgi:hypothetical protein
MKDDSVADAEKKVRLDPMAALEAMGCLIHHKAQDVVTMQQVGHMVFIRELVRDGKIFG